MLKETSLKKTELTVKDMVTAAIIGAGAFAAALFVKRLSHSDPPIIISDGSLYVKSENLWESPSQHVHELKPKGPMLHPGAEVGTVDFVYDGMEVDLTPGDGEPLDITILYGESESRHDTIHVTTNPAHHHLSIYADDGEFNGSLLSFYRQLNEGGHIVSVSAPGKGPYVPSTTGSQLEIYFA